MSRNKSRPRKLQLEGLPLRNITASLNFNLPTVSAKPKMSYSSDSGFSNLTHSPMSSLTFNLSELSTGRTTPRRRLSMSDIDTPPQDGYKTNDEGMFSAESGCFSGSPLDDSPTLDRLNAKNRYTTLLHPDIPIEAFSAKKKTIAYRRISSEPLPTLRLDSPTDFLDDEDNPVLSKDVEKKTDDDGFSLEDAFSQDSGLGMEKRSISMSSFDDDELVGSLPSLDDVWNSMEPSDFKAPRGKPPKRTRSVTEDRLFSEDTCSPIKYSPVKSSLPRPSFAQSLFSEVSTSQESSAKKVVTDKSEIKSSSDDGFQELFDIEDLQNEADDQVSSLMSAPLLHDLRRDKGDDLGLSFLSRHVSNGCKRVKFCKEDEKDSTPTSRSTNPRRIFQRSQSLDIRPRMSSKRCEPPEDICDLVSNSKRLKGDNDNNEIVAFSPANANSNSAPSNDNMDDLISHVTIPCARRLHRCHSESEATIKSAVSRMAMEPNLIGDCSKPYCLPIIEGKHQDLKSISGETLCRVLGHEYDHVIEEFHILDCRYPYEYEGGHIKNALNIYTKDGVLEKFLKSPMTPKDPNKRIILIFHCEFSSERGPGLSRFLRRHDRESNKECYPFLHYPELYLLEGGYKNFFEYYDYLCEPRQYRTMLDKNHAEDLRKFRAKSKSWAGEKSHGRPGIRNIKF